MIRTVEWFAGIGGLRLAMQRAEGFVVEDAVEIDAGKAACYRAHFDRLTEGDAFKFSPPQVDLWAACAAPKLLAQLFMLPKRPDTFWLQTAPQDVSRLTLPDYQRHEFIANGRVHVLLSRKPIDVDGLENGEKIHQPDARYMKPDRPFVRTIEEAEEAQGFPAGWTAMPGVEELQRRYWLAASEHVPSCTAIARRIAECV